MGVINDISPMLTEWSPCTRIIPSRFPPIQLFETVADPKDLEAVFALESLTNPRLREEAGTLEHVRPEDRVSGAGSSYLMAPFTHLNPEGSRFSPGSFGVFYAAKELETAIAETIYHLVKHMRDTNEPPQDLDMRVLHADLKANLVVLSQAEHGSLLNSVNYTASQHFGIEIKKQGLDGIHYPSVRRPGGECAAVFRPCLLSNCRQAMHLGYPWDGNNINLT